MQAGDALPPGGSGGRGIFTIPRRWYRRYDLLLLFFSVLMLFAWPKLWGNLTASGYMPHGHCYFWIPELVALHLASDALIGLAYVSISATLAYLVYRARRDIPFHWVFLAFGLFIVACGMTHWMEVWTIWHATYWLSGYVKLITAVASVATAVVLPPLVPKTLEMVRAAKLSEERKARLVRANKELEELRERESRQAEERIAQLAAIVESSEDAIIGETLEGVITSWNRGAEKLYGYTLAEAAGRHLSLIAPPELREEVTGFLDKVGRGEAVETFETVRRRKDGALIDVSVTVSPVRDASGRTVGASTIARDITARKRAEAEVRRLNEELERRVADRTAQLEAANGELEAFSYSVSHDLRAPLRSVDGFAQALEEDYGGRLDDEGRGYLKRVRAATQRMGQLIDDLLKLSRVTRAEMMREEVSLTEVAREVAGELKESRPGRDVTFRVEEGLVARADGRLLRILLENLLGNAWKFTSRREQALIEVGAVAHDGGRAFYVRDNGAGFDMAYAGKMFGAFQRMHGASEFEGTGIGLATVARIVHRHGGRVWAEGAVGHGATFYFTL